MKKRIRIAFLGAIFSMLSGMFLSIVAIYIASINPNNGNLIFYLGLSGLCCVCIAILLFRCGYNMILAEEFDKLIEKSKN